MADEEKIAEADETVADEAAADDVDIAGAEPAATLDLHVRPSEDDDTAELLGVPPEEPAEAIGATAKRSKWTIAGLFGSTKATDDDDSMDDGAKWAVPGASGSRPRREGGGIRLINRVLAAVIVLILFFGVLDLFATNRGQTGDGRIIDAVRGGNDVASETGGPASTGGLPLLSKLLDSFKKRRIVRPLDQGPGGTTAQFEPTRKAQVPNWKVYATQNMELIGLSGTPEGEREAIVSDRKAGQIHILQVEQEMVAGENQFKLIRIATDHVVFEKDGEEIEVK